ncbi:tRNA (adenosine(37)-N6)-threonylcarbamoyltransferase complex transferase subunit TsaD [Patescibacteria group bacterium]|nr:tRNA (adenosine(37)-N6)-threonylcarbamoyltransferase complex transferase subunit TsaD [Patescibacteria group bacterium]
MNIILGIETSCDDTAVALVEDGKKILGSLVSSQVKLHSKFGGVVPEVASRQHLTTILPLIEELLKQAKIGVGQIDALAVTSGPGLLGSLLIGLNTAKTLAYLWKKPLIEVDHLIGHIYSNWLSNNIVAQWPMLALVVSGGHSELIIMNGFNKFKSIGGTRDDAAGEAFDKAAKIMGLGYPGGPAVAAEAAKVKNETLRRDSGHNLKKEVGEITLPRPMLAMGLDMSFSGLKTALSKIASNFDKKALAHEFQQAVVDVLATKTERAIKKYHPRAILLAGGVAANQVLRERLGQVALRQKVDYYVPELKYCMDNAAMIALAAYFLRGSKNNRWYNVKVKTTSEIFA